MSPRMSGPFRGTSSGAAEACEEAFLVADDAGDGLGLRSRIPLVELERSAEDDAVGPREHVAGTEGERVIYVRLRLENRKLPAGGVQVRVAEQVAAAEPCAIEDEAFRQRGDVRGCRELADLDPAARDLQVPDHLPEIAPRLDVHRVIENDIVDRERVLGAGEHAIDRREI